MPEPLPRSRVREALVGCAMMLASVLSVLLVSEIAVRALASGGEVFEWRNYASDPGQWEGRWKIMQPDPQLGYSPRPGYRGTDHGGGGFFSFDADGLRNHHEDGPKPARESPPVLVVGDSYPMGVQVDDDAAWPALLQTMLDRRVLNGGVPGYGVDQFVLRAERLAPKFRPDVIVAGFIADDVRRTGMRILWGLQKPYFDVVDGALVPRNVPVRPPAPEDSELDPLRAVLGYSFLADVAMRRLGLYRWWRRGQPSHVEPAHDRGAEVACLLMGRLKALGETTGARVLMVAQYTPQAWTDPAFLRYEVGVASALLACARAAGLATLDTRTEVEAAVRAKGVEAYYIGTHMSEAGNRLTAELIAKALK